MNCTTQLPLLQAQTLQNEPSLVLAVPLSLMEGCGCACLCSAPPTSNLLEAPLFLHPPHSSPTLFVGFFFSALVCSHHVSNTKRWTVERSWL